MVPNRRLREEMARADKLAKERRKQSHFDDQATVVPTEDRVPEETRPGHVRDYAADILEVDEEMELNTGDIEKVEAFDLATSDIDVSDLTDEGAPNPDFMKTVVPKRPQQQFQQQKYKLHRRRDPVADFDEDQTRIDPPSDPDVEVLEINEHQEPAPRLIKAQKLPLDEFPSEKSVVSRIVKSVVAALPSAIRKAVDKTGQHSLHPKKKDPSVQINVEERQQSSGVDARAWREMRTSPIFDGLPNEALRDALMSGDAHVLRLVRDSLVPMDGSIALVRSGQVASPASPKRRSPPSARRRTPTPSAAAARTASSTRRSASGATRSARSSASPSRTWRPSRTATSSRPPSAPPTTPRSPATRRRRRW